MGPVQPSDQTTAAAAATTEAADDKNSGHATPGGESHVEIMSTIEVHSDAPKLVAPETPAPIPSRGDGPSNLPKVR